MLSFSPPFSCIVLGYDKLNKLLMLSLTMYDSFWLDCMNTKGADILLNALVTVMIFFVFW